MTSSFLHCLCNFKIQFSREFDLYQHHHCPCLHQKCNASNYLGKFLGSSKSSSKAFSAGKKVHHKTSSTNFHIEDFHKDKIQLFYSKMENYTYEFDIFQLPYFLYLYPRVLFFFSSFHVKNIRLNSAKKCGYNSRACTIQGRVLLEEIR